MDKGELTQESELRDRDIRTSRGLETFETTNTNTNMGGLDHGDIVCAVANGQENLGRILLDQLDHQCLL